MGLDGATIAIWLVFLATALPIATIVLSVIAASTYTEKDNNQDVPYKVEPKENKKEKD
jgi:hypothetical protein